MHDVGKIGISDAILLKPGELNSDEWEAMKRQEYGASIIGDDPHPLFVAAREIALTHHEKWDASGYPGGLKGEAIPLFGRITAIADVFDALTSERPYKKAWEVETAFEFIRHARGKHFDPTLVDIFFSIDGEIMELRQQYGEDERSILWIPSGDPVSDVIGTLAPH